MEVSLLHIQIEQNQLSALLGRVIKAVETRNTIPILGNVLLTAENDTLTAVATDLDVEITSRVPASVMNPGSTTVSASLLQSIVDKLKKGSLVSLDAENFKLNVKSGRSDLSLSALPIEDFPRIANDTYNVYFNAPQKDIKRLLDLTSFAMSAEETRFYLQGVYLHTIDAQVKAVATDGHRLALVGADINASFNGVIVPRKTVALLRSLMNGGDVKVSISDHKVRFDTEDSVVVSKVIDGTYPDYQRVIPRSYDTSAVVNGDDVKQAAALVSLVSQERAKAVNVSTQDGLLRLEVRNGAEVGIEEVDAAIDGPSVEVGVNSKYLSDILNACTSDNAVIQFGKSGDPIVVKPECDSDALFVVMPMRH